MYKTPGLSSDDRTHSSTFKKTCLNVGLLIGVLTMASSHLWALDHTKSIASQTSVQDSTPISSQYTGIIAIPQYSPDIQHFVPEGYYLDRGFFANGDLNGDGLTDHAFAISDDEGIAVEKGTCSDVHPLVIVAFTEGDNKLRRACVAPHIVEQLGAWSCSHVMITKGNIVFSGKGENSHGGKSAEITFHWERPLCSCEQQVGTERAVLLF